jgi:hypothetical protein
MTMHPPSHDDGATVGDSVDHVETIAPPYLGNRSMLPFGEDILPDAALDDMPRAVLGLVASLRGAPNAPRSPPTRNIAKRNRLRRLRAPTEAKIQVIQPS